MVRLVGIIKPVTQEEAQKLFDCPHTSVGTVLVEKHSFPPEGPAAFAAADIETVLGKNFQRRLEVTRIKFQIITASEAAQHGQTNGSWTFAGGDLILFDLSQLVGLAKERKMRFRIRPRFTIRNRHPGSTQPC